jgi:hypothetical protein
MRKRTSHSCPKKSLQPLSKGSDKYGSFDQIAAEMYVICTLLGEVDGMVRRFYPVRRLGL